MYDVLQGVRVVVDDQNGLPGARGRPGGLHGVLDRRGHGHVQGQADREG